MFDFLFKRPAAQQDTATPVTPSDTPQKEDKDATRAQEKQIALQQAHALAQDEAAAATFIAQCPFADARLVAAEHIQSKAAMEQVLQAIRNTDRRVAKLMQQRLQALAHLAAQQQQLQECVQLAEKLLADPQLTANLVADLDRAWNMAATGIEHPEFTRIRALLDQRLQAQMALQKTIRQQIMASRDLANQDHAALAAHVGNLASQMQAWQQDQEIHSVPKTLLQEIQTDYQQLAARVAQGMKVLERANAALQQYQQALSAWEAQDRASLSAADIKRQWRALPAFADLPEAEASALQVRYHEILQSLRPDEAVAAPAAVEPAPETVPITPAPPLAARNKPIQQDPQAQQQFAQALNALEQSLEQGLLHIAFEQDKILRDLKSVKPGKQQSARMAQARAELHRLQGWAKWGGNISREELIKAVEELPQQHLAIAELARKVGSMRERWKKLDVASGAAPKPLWERFDTACTSAYAPAAAHFKKQAEERQQNLRQAEELIAQIDQMNQQFQADSADWKHIASLHQRLRQAWHHLGPIERKDKKRLDAEFDKKLAVTWQPLQQQRAEEMARREQLISEVKACNPQQRNTPELLHQLQERWQALAKALPLERKPEQEMWQRFRAACDAVFAARKESAQVLDSERRTHFHEKEAICASLETARDLDAAEQTKLLRTSQERWHAIGAVPRAQEAAIEQRFNQARQRLQHQIDHARRSAKQAEMAQVVDKLHLCQALENLPERANLDAAAWQARWHAMPGLARDLEGVLSKRFQDALSGDATYLQRLQQERARFLPELLRLEIMLSLESPAEFARERLKIQVEVLQSSLRSGQKAEPPQKLLHRLCAWPVQLAPLEAKRLDTILTTLLG